jgi:hypothetical protein
MSFDFVSGLITMGFGVSGLFFLRYWARSKERLFLAFALAFWLLALNQGLLVMMPTVLEERSWLYLLRVAAFGLIIAAVVAKNRRL